MKVKFSLELKFFKVMGWVVLAIAGTWKFLSPPPSPALRDIRFSRYFLLLLLLLYLFLLLLISDGNWNSDGN